MASIDVDPAPPKMLNFFGDTSGKRDDAGRFVIVAAGYLATERAWAAFGSDWTTALNDAGVAGFHAAEFFSYRGEFASWIADVRKHNRFAKRFTAIAESHASQGIGYGLKVAELYDELLAPTMQRFATLHGKLTPLMFTTTSVLARLAVMPRAPGEQIAVVFEQEPGMGEAVEYWNWLKAKKRERWTDAYASFGTAGKECLPLQAADLLAHESWRSVCETYYPSGRAERKSMTRLTKRDRVLLVAAKESAFHEMSARFNVYFEKYPGGLMGPGVGR